MITPLRDRIILKINKGAAKEEKSDSGIILSTVTNQAKPLQEGIVEQIGPLVEYIEVGDYIYFEEHASYDINLNGVVKTAINEPSVIAVDKDIKISKQAQAINENK